MEAKLAETIAKKEKLQKRTSELALQALGRSVIAWSYLERAVEHSLGILLGQCGMPFEESLVVATNVPLRDRVPLIATLAHRKYATRPWFSQLIELTNRVNNELRNRRNRIMHDSWAEGDEGFLERRSSVKPKLVRPQARKYELVSPNFERVDYEDISAFITDCLTTANELSEVNTKMNHCG